MIYMLRKEWISAEFYKFISKKEHFLYLNGKNVLYPKIAEIVWKFINENEKTSNQLRNNLCQFKEIFQYVYSILYLEIHCTTKLRGFDLKSTFQLFFKTYKDKKKVRASRKRTKKFYKKKEMKNFKFEQKPSEIDNFNNAEEEEEVNEKT